MTSKELMVVLAGNLAGRVVQERNKLRFTYDSSWRTSVQAIPLSLSMPLASSEHGHEAVNAFLWGLLPDNEQVLTRWGQRFQVSASNAFALLCHVGEDCAGALQLVLPERLSDFVGNTGGDVAWLTEAEIAERLRTLRADHSRARLVRDHGQFSLAGAQAKTALFFQAGRWGVPSGRTPTTHILKPPIAGLPGHVENEHVCLSVARELGFPSASSQIRTFEDQKVIVVERYDRYQLAAHQPVLRLHQEDLCQALGLLPTLKYQNEGGPAPQTIAELLRGYSARPSEDVATFAGALLFNWLIAGTDAHAKNYSLLMSARGQVRLAPLYDLGSALPYPDMDQRRLKLAMKLGDTYLIRNVAARQVGQLAAALAIDPEQLLSQARDLAARMLAAIDVVGERAKEEGSEEATVDLLCKLLREHAMRCAKQL